MDFVRIEQNRIEHVLVEMLGKEAQVWDWGGQVVHYGQLPQHLYQKMYIRACAVNFEYDKYQNLT